MGTLKQYNSVPVKNNCVLLFFIIILHFLPFQFLSYFNFRYFSYFLNFVSFTFNSNSILSISHVIFLLNISVF